MENMKLYETIKLILKPEKSFFLTSIIYGIGVSVLMLTVPISVQALINSVTFGVLLQPLVILSVILFGLLLFSGVLSALQAYTIEGFQNHFYVRISSEIISKIISSSQSDLSKKNYYDLANKYFDVMTIQKSMTTLLTGGVSIIMQTLTGLVLLAFYHPYFLAFDLLLIFLLFCVWRFFYKNGFATAVAESKAKYQTGQIFDQILELENFSKSRKRREDIVKKGDFLISDYIKKRRRHFKIVFQQKVLLLAIYALMSSLILGLGGYLVIIQQLSLGQLVAAELVVTVILASFSKAYKYIEALYDLYAACDKISVFYRIKQENFENQITKIDTGNINFKKVSIELGNSSYNFDFDFMRGKKYLINSNHFTYQEVFLSLLQKKIRPKSGAIYYGANYYNDISTLDIRDKIYVSSKPNIIQGSISDNITFGNKQGLGEIDRSIIEDCDLEVIENYFQEGLNLEILPNGYPLWSNQIYRLELARILMSDADVIVISDYFDQISKKRREKFLGRMMSSDKTFILISNHHYPQFQFDEHLDFRDGQIQMIKTDKLERGL